jgi:serine/threonine-protein kinase
MPRAYQLAARLAWRRVERRRAPSAALYAGGVIQDEDEDVTQVVARVVRTLRMQEPLARTLESAPRDTLRPLREVPPSGRSALAALGAAGPPADSRFVLEGRLAEGGMGVVDLAVQTSMGRKVAVKTLRDAGDPAVAVRAMREAWVTGQLEHPNVVPVHDVGLSADGAPFIVMKRIEGAPWSSLLTAPELVRSRFGADDVVEWHLGVLETVCNAVAFAHARDIVHRDLKPENVMIGSFGEVYVVDWGLALSLAPDPTGRLPGRDEARVVAGTPAYMAPEMILADADAIAETTDVYLLGAILYEVFSGSPPHVAADMTALVGRILASEPEFPRGFPAEAKGIVTRAMARAPADRYPSAAAFRDVLRAYLRHRGSRRLAWEAKRSLVDLVDRASAARGGDADDLALYNLLGEARFGFRAALEAWPENQAARQGLDRALITMVEHELSRGEPAAAAALLRDVSGAPDELRARVDEAAKTRGEEDVRRRALEADLDPRTGTRTRTFIGSLFGVLWTVTPLVAWLYDARGDGPTHASLLVASAGFLALGLLLYRWARASLGRTRLNRQLSSTLGLHLVAQACLAIGAEHLGLSARASATLHVFSWMLTMLLLGVWVERWFFVPAAFDGLLFLASAAAPTLVYPLMAAANLLFTAVLVYVWFPRQDLARIEEQRQRLEAEARRLLFLNDRRAWGGSPESGEG